MKKSDSRPEEKLVTQLLSLPGGSGKEQPVISDRRVSIVVLNGSPHRDGNTATLMGWVVAGCVEAGASVEWIHLVDHSIDYCQGCFTCLRTGECHIQDGFAQVRRRMEMADGIIVGSPMYAGQPTAQLKTFLDRLTLLNLYTHVFERQRSVAVVTSGVTTINVAPIGTSGIVFSR